MVSGKLFWLYTVGLIFFTSQLYAGCSLATLKGSYSYQNEIQIQGKQCQISGTWLMDGKGGGLGERKSSNCPELAKPESTTFRYKLGADCQGHSISPDNENDFQVMDDGTIRLLQDVKDEAIGTVNHPLSPDDIKTIWQGQVNWNNNGSPSADLPFYQTKWQQLQAGWRALKFKALTHCPLKPQGNYAYQGKFTIGGKPCQGTGNWLFNDTGAGWMQGKTQCLGQTDIIVNNPFRYVFDDLCLATLHVPNGSQEGDNLIFMGDDKLKLTFTAQAKATGTFSHTLRKDEANSIQQHLTNWDNKESLNKWEALLNAGMQALKTGNHQQAEKNIQTVLALAKAVKVEGKSWDDFIEVGIKAGETGNYAKAEQQLQSAKALGYVASSQLLSGTLLTEQGHLKQANSFYQQCLNTLKSKSPETVHTTHFSQKMLATDYNESEITYKTIFVLCLTQLAKNHLREKDYNSVEPLYVKGLYIAQKTLPKTNTALSDTLSSYAHFEILIHNYTKAKALQRQLLDILQNTLPRNHPDIGLSFLDIGQIDLLQKRYREAEQNLQKSLDILKNASPEKPLDLAYVLLNLTRLYQEQGRYSEAEENLQKSMEILKKNPQEKPDYLADALQNSSGIYQNQGRYSDTEKILLQSMEMRRKLHGDDHPLTLETLSKIAVNYLDQGQAIKSEELLRQVLDKQKNLPTNDIVKYQQNLAATLFEQNRYYDAEKVYLETLNMEKENSNNTVDFYNVYNGIGILYISLSKYDKAEYYLKKGLVHKIIKYQDNRHTQ